MRGARHPIPLKRKRRLFPKRRRLGVAFPCFLSASNSVSNFSGLLFVFLFVSSPERPAFDQVPVEHGASGENLEYDVVEVLTE